MKFIGIVAAFAASALAQRIAIGAPPPGSDISPGQSLTVEVDRPVSPCHPRFMCLDLRSFAILLRIPSLDPRRCRLPSVSFHAPRSRTEVVTLSMFLKISELYFSLVPTHLSSPTLRSHRTKTSPSKFRIVFHWEQHL